MTVRKQLLERELSRLGFRKPGSHEGGSAQQQAQPQAGASAHPQAGEGLDRGQGGHAD